MKKFHWKISIKISTLQLVTINRKYINFSLKRILQLMFLKLFFFNKYPYKNIKINKVNKMDKLPIAMMLCTMEWFVKCVLFKRSCGTRRKWKLLVVAKKEKNKIKNINCFIRKKMLKPVRHRIVHLLWQVFLIKIFTTNEGLAQ